MSAKGDSRITSYFHRITPGKKTPAKRTRPTDEADVVSRISAKKSKGRQEQDKETKCQPSVATPPRISPSPSRRPTKKVARAVNDIRETSPGTPVKSASLRVATPSTSPLPELTPSPSPPRLRSLSQFCRTYDGVKDNGLGASYIASTGISSSEHQEVELECIPSSQTQVLDLIQVEDPEVPDDPLQNISSRGSEHHKFSRSSSCIPSSQPDTLSLNLLTEPDELIASSQSQFMELTPTSPIDPGSEVVPSSQTQELIYSQVADPAQLYGETLPPSEPRSSFLDTYLDEPEVPSQSSVRQCSPQTEITPTAPNNSQAESLSDEGIQHYTPAIPKSQNPSSPSSLSVPDGKDDENLSSTQPSEVPWNEDISSYESLPDAVKELRDMFSGTYESYPPDFPMSLR